MHSTQLQLAEAAHQRGDLGEAQRCYEGSLAQGEPDRAGALYGLGTLALQRGAQSEAVELLGQAATIAPDAADINFNYALCLHKTGQNERAGQVALRVAALCHGDAAFSWAVCQLLLDLGQPSAVISQLAGLPRMDAQGYLLLARAKGAQGNWDESVTILRQLAEQYQDSAPIALELSMAAARLRDYPLAIATYQHFMNVSEPSAGSHLRFADLYLMARDPVRSAEQLEEARLGGADDAEYHLMDARLARLRGDDQHATAASDAALSRQSGLGQAWLVRVETAGPEQLPGLIERMEASDAGTPYQQTLVYYALADAHRALGNTPGAARALRLANALQIKNLQDNGWRYDAPMEENKHRYTRAQFGSNRAVAEILPNRPVPIFIVGMPRSGTTLLEKILARIVGVTALGENEALGFVASRYRRDVEAGRLPEPEGMTSEQWQQLAQRYYELTPVNSTHFVDKMPFNFLHVGMALSMFPNAKIIQMRRDPGDVCLSIYSKPFPDGHNYACEPQALAHTFNEARKLMDFWQGLDAGRVLDVHFEKFVREPVAQGQRVAHFCGLPWSDSCLDFHRDVSASFTFSEKQVREAISDAPVGQWQAFAADLPELFAAIEQHSP